MSTDTAVRGWLRDRGAEQIAHPGGNLYAHLCRVSDRLAALGCDGDVQAAGLTHAVYGTDGFDLTLLDRADRAVLRDLIGADAEERCYGSPEIEDHVAATVPRSSFQALAERGPRSQVDGQIGKRPWRHCQWRPAARWSTIARWRAVRRGS
ncbi:MULTISPECIES: DUF6817 domain-containing protein [unclassified Micromonospora]|uniref:DUF6817 domain-containing protein n=1 Tax=unclassified Micromonospora TaxID=2617518 RepID=UPI0033A9072C